MIRLDRRRPRACEVAEGTTILDACSRGRHRHADALLGANLTPSTRAASAWSRSRARGRWCRPARARPRTGWSCRPTPSGSATAASSCWSSWLVGRPVDQRRRRLDGDWHRATTDRRRRRRRDARTPGTIRSTAPVDGTAGEGRQRALRARLREVHPLLQVRRGLRRRRPEHVRHRRRGPRLRRPHLHRVRRRAARLGLRLLRQLHRRLPDRRADVQERVRHARGRGLAPGGRRPSPRPSAPTAASAATWSCTCRTSASSRSPVPSTTRSPAATSASRAASAGSTSKARPRVDVHREWIRSRLSPSGDYRHTGHPCRSGGGVWGSSGSRSYSAWPWPPVGAPATSTCPTTRQGSSSRCPTTGR